MPHNQLRTDDWPANFSWPRTAARNVGRHYIGACDFRSDGSVEMFQGVGAGIMKTAIEPGAPAVAATDPAAWVDEHGDVLYRYALSRVRKPDVAQDLVQESMSELLSRQFGWLAFVEHNS